MYRYTVREVDVYPNSIDHFVDAEKKCLSSALAALLEKNSTTYRHLPIAQCGNAVRCVNSLFDAKLQ